MTAEELLAALRGRGLQVEAAGGLLRVGPADLLTDADRDTIRAYRPALIAAVRRDGGDGGHGSLAAPLPGPGRAYFALLPGGLAVRRPAGSCLPDGATFWCYPGAARWTPVPLPATGLARGG